MRHTLSRFRTTAALAAVLALVLTTVLAPFASAQSTTTPEVPLESNQGVIQVQGSGTVTGTPDTASIYVGVQASEVSLTDAQSQITDRGNAIKKVFTDGGVEDKDIQTVSYSINPVPDYDRDGQYRGIKRYDIVLMYSVKVRDITKAGKMLDASVQAGANYIGGIQLYVEDMDPLTAQAREAAIADARTKAEVYAKGTNSKIVGVRTITETSAPASDEQSYSGAQPAMAEASDVSKTRQSEVPVSAGTSSVVVTVAVEFVIEPAN